MEFISTILLYLPLLLQAATTTIAAWLVSSIISLCMGIIVGIASCQQLTSPLVSNITRIYIFIARGIPPYVQILIAYFVIPEVIGIHISGFIAATCALGFWASGDIAEIIRFGINAAPQDQWDACTVLGYSWYSTLTHIILPQTMTNILRPVLEKLEHILRSTSLLGTIGVFEITRVGMNMVSRDLNPVTIYMMIALIYLGLSFITQYISSLLEKRISNGYHP